MLTFLQTVFLLELCYTQWYSFLSCLARSPIYSHLSTTIQGLPVIRSYSMQSVAMETFHTFQNQHSRAWYLYLVSNRWVHYSCNWKFITLILFRWFGMRIDLISNIFTAIVAFSSVLFRLTAGKNALAMKHSFSSLLFVQQFSWTLHYWA